MSRIFGIALSRVAGDAPFSVTPVVGTNQTSSDDFGPLKQAIFDDSIEYKLKGDTPEGISSTISELIGPTDDNLAISIPVALPDAQRKAIRHGVAKFTMDHSTAIIHLNDYRAASNDGGALGIIFVDLTPGQVAAKLSSAETEENELLISSEGLVVLGDASTGELSTQEVIDKLVNPMVRQTNIDRVYILRPEGPSSKLSSALEARFPGAPVKWVTLAEISRGAAAAIHRRPQGDTYQMPITLFTPVPVGIALSSGRLVPVVPRNLVLPNRRTAIFTTSQDNQTSATLEIVTGKTPSGKVVFEGLTPQAKGVARIKVSFDIDADGETVVTIEDLHSEAIKVANIPAFTKQDADAYWDDESSHQIEQEANESGVLGELPE